MISKCPVCSSDPYVEQVESWPGRLGAAPWAVGCYKMIPTEHFVGVNGDTKEQALSNWEYEVKKARLMAEPQRL